MNKVLTTEGESELKIHIEILRIISFVTSNIIEEERKANKYYTQISACVFFKPCYNSVSFPEGWMFLFSSSEGITVRLGDVSCLPTNSSASFIIDQSLEHCFVTKKEH
jgi:hypothetical protein